MACICRLPTSPAAAPPAALPGSALQIVMEGPRPADKKPWAERGAGEDPVRGGASRLRAAAYMDKGYLVATSWREADGTLIALAA